MSYPFILQGKNIVIVIDNVSHNIGPSHLAYEKIKDALRSQDWETVRDLIEPKKVVLNYGVGNISIQGDTLFWRGEEFHNALSERMISMLTEGFPIDPLVKFMDNLLENPSFRSVNELYGFLEKNNLPITPDGHFLAYKKVRGNYYDCHTGKVLNKPAHLLSLSELMTLPTTVDGVTVEVKDGCTVVSMPRYKVNDNCTQTCSDGLHFCSQEYLKSFSGEHTLILKINPKDVVSIPVDYNNSKGRTCAYTVVGELGVRPEEAFTATVQETANTVTEPTYEYWPQPHSNS